MQHLKTLRVVLLFIVVLALAACGGTAAPAANNQSAAGDPAAAAKGFVDAAFTGGDVTSFVCQAAGVDQLKEAFEMLAATYKQANATIDTTGLTYAVSDQTDTVANVTVGGNLKVTIAGVAQDIPMTDASMVVPVKKEGDAWKVCV
jgi:ABC-type glycerol-3-phosphate transport system substrate-binding protein